MTMTTEQFIDKMVQILSKETIQARIAANTTIQAIRESVTEMNNRALLKGWITVEQYLSYEADNWDKNREKSLTK